MYVANEHKLEHKHKRSFGNNHCIIQANAAESSFVTVSNYLSMWCFCHVWPLMADDPSQPVFKSLDSANSVNFET